MRRLFVLFVLLFGQKKKEGVGLKKCFAFFIFIFNP